MRLSFPIPALLLGVAAWSVLGARRRRHLARELWFVLVLTALAVGDRWVLGFPSKDLLFLQHEFAADIAAGDFFVSTATGLGKPVLAHPLSPILTPFSLVLALPWTAFTLQAFVTLHVLWGAAWWLVLLRERGDAFRGRDPWWPRALAALALLGGFVIARFGGQQGIEYALAAMWAPSLMFALQGLVRGRRGTAAHALLAGLSASAALALCPNLFVALVGCATLFVVVCLIARARGPSRGPSRVTSRVTRMAAAGLRLVAAGAVGALMALPELIPAIDALARNAGFTYRHDPTSYRFRAFDAAELWHAFTGLGVVDFGRTALFGGVTLAGCALLLAGRRRLRVVPAAAGALLLLGALDWAAHGIGYGLATAALPALASFSIAPTVEAVLTWSVVALVATTSAPGRRAISLAALVVIVIGSGLTTRIHRGVPGYDLEREARLFVWAEPPAGALVIDAQPVTERAYLLPDPIARARGIRTVGEDWYSLLPREFYETLPTRRAEAPADWAVTMGLPPPGTWSRVNSYDAYELAAAQDARDSLFALTVRMMREENPAWDGRVAVYRRSGAPVASATPTEDTPPAGWPWLGLAWPALLVAALISVRSGRGGT